MEKELVINVSGGETRTALLENGQLAEIGIERAKKSGGVGTIYKGRVKKVLPGMQSAFVDIGLVKDSFLSISDVDERLKNFDFFDEEYLKKPPVGDGRRKRRGSDSRKIDEILSVGQELLVQIVHQN